jgi:serine/threonine protein kinase
VQTTDRLNSALAGRYQVDRQIGEGGMATVYLARDVRHDRKVALKVLHPDLAAALGAERFLAEIKTTANLQHPHILPLHDSGEADGFLFYVMPYVAGETLRARLMREQQLPIDDALRITTEVLSALDYAHRSGVIHRDIKPENVLLHDGSALVADFGIALAVTAAGGQRMTQTGLSLGTPQYMSPEQATGDKHIDGRSDIYSAAAVLYEMLTGEPPFSGATVQSIVAKVLTDRPAPPSIVRDTIPAHVEAAVLKSLAKVPADRFQSAAQFSRALTDATSSTGTLASQRTSPLPTRRAPMGLMATALAATSLLAATFAALWLVETSVDKALSQRILQFVIDIPPDRRLATINESSVALSPGGDMIAYVARTTSNAAAQIFVRRLDSLSARREPLLGMAPMFSADGRWLYYRAAADIRRVPVNGGSAEVVLPIVSWQGYGLSPVGVMAVSANGGIHRVDDKGVKQLLASPDSVAGEASLADPSFLDATTLAFWIQRRDDATGKAIGITTLDGGEHTVLNISGQRTFGMLDGHLLVGTEEGTLLAYPFNVRRRRIDGPPVVLLDSVVAIIAGGLQLSRGSEGSLAYLRGSSRVSMALVDKRGSTIAESPTTAEFRRGDLSPDGRRAAVTILRNTVGGLNQINQDVWTWDIESGALARFTTDGGGSPTWTPDGRRIAFLRPTGRLQNEVVSAPADGSAPPELLVPAPSGKRIVDFTLAHGGRTALITALDSGRTTDLYSVDLTSADRTLKPLIVTRFAELAPSVSTDGRWLAYLSNETGRNEVYVRPWSSPTGRIRVTSQGGTSPEWLAGNRMVAFDGGRRLISEIRERSGTITAVVRDSLTWLGTRLAVDAAGERILLTREPADWRIVVVKNWEEEARRRLRAR